MSTAKNMGMRIDEVRSRAQTVRDGTALVLHSAYAATNAPASAAAAAWGEPVKLDSYDILQLLIDYTAGTVTTGVTVVAQVSSARQDEPQVGADWYDLYVIDPTDGSTVLWTAIFSSATSARFAAKMNLDGSRWIRFKVFAPGANQANSRIVLRGLPDKLST